MDTFSAWARARAHKGQEHMVFDWARAAELIRERKPIEASAGLSGDWEYTGGAIFRDGAPIPRGETYTYLASNWATPELDMDGDVIACYRMQSQVPDWDSRTYWPDEALAIIKAD